jgi:hypothetical protein
MGVSRKTSHANDAVQERARWVLYKIAAIILTKLPFVKIGYFYPRLPPWEHVHESQKYTYRPRN